MKMITDEYHLVSHRAATVFSASRRWSCQCAFKLVCPSRNIHRCVSFLSIARYVVSVDQSTET